MYVHIIYGVNYKMTVTVRILSSKSVHSY